MEGWHPDSWESECITALKQSSTFQWDRDLVDKYGRPLSKLTDKAWGIGVRTCLQYCNFDQIPYAPRFSSLWSSIWGPFLPWLALTTQLPYQTGRSRENVMSFFLAVGSPALITYSLAITILNRLWVRRKFEALRMKASTSLSPGWFDVYESRISAVRFLLQEGQQVPLRASQGKGWLSSLIVIPENETWWKRLETRLKSTRRGFTASLVTQMLFAIVVFLFTILSSFNTALGGSAASLQIASGSLWLWLVSYLHYFVTSAILTYSRIPIIVGWIAVGTQNRADTIDEALGNDEAFRAVDSYNDYGTHRTELKAQRGLVVWRGLHPQPYSIRTLIRGYGPRRSQLTTFFGVDVWGDEQQKGPIHNYARLFTWWQLMSLLEGALSKTLDGIAHGQVCSRRSHPGDLEETAEYCGLANKPILAYPRWSDVPPQVYRTMVFASIAALCLQWSTTGASFLIAYLTPAAGLGCRSFSYIAYGSMATIVWLCLVASMLISHAVMLRYQEAHVENPSTDFSTRREPNNPDHYTRTFSHGCLCAASIILRYLGKCLAAFNALWLIESWLLELMGRFDNCLCKGNALGLGRDGWIVLFWERSDLDAAASAFLVNVIVTTTAIFVSACYVVFVLRRSKTLQSVSLSRLLARALRPRAPPGHHRIFWRCHCGKEIYGDFKNTEIESIAELRAKLNHRPDATGTSSRERTEPGTSISSVQSSQEAQPSVRAPKIDPTTFSSSNNRVKTQIAVLSPNSPPSSKFIELCVNTGQSCQTLGEIDVTNVWTDVQLFRLIRSRYRQLRGWRLKRFFFMKPSGMDFVSFFLENRQKVHISRRNSFPSESAVSRGAYHYEPCPMKPTPPMPSHAFIHWLHYCDLDSWPMQRCWLDRLPKKLNGSLESSCESLPIGWGMHVTEGADGGAILWAMILAIIVCFGPVVAYIVCTRDVQSGMAVASVVFSILTLLWCCMQVDVAKNN